MLATLFSHFSAFVKQLVEDLDLFDLECKLGMFRVRLSVLIVPSRAFLFVLHVRIRRGEHDAKIFTARPYESVFFSRRRATELEELFERAQILVLP